MPRRKSRLVIKKAPLQAAEPHGRRGETQNEPKVQKHLKNEDKRVIKSPKYAGDDDEGEEEEGEIKVRDVKEANIVKKKKWKEIKISEEEKYIKKVKEDIQRLERENEKQKELIEIQSGELQAKENKIRSLEDEKKEMAKALDLQDEMLGALNDTIRNHCWVYLTLNADILIEKLSALDGIVLQDKEYFVDAVVINSSKLCSACVKEVLSFVQRRKYVSARSLIIFAVGTKRQVLEDAFLPELFNEREQPERFAYVSANNSDLCQVNNKKEEDSLHHVKDSRDIMKSVHRRKTIEAEKILTLGYPNKRLIRIIDVGLNSDI